MLTAWIFVLCIYKQNFSAIILRADGEVQPYRVVAISLDKQLVKLLFAFISIIKEYHSIPQRLLHAAYPYIRRAARHVIAIRIPMNRLI